MLNIQIDVSTFPMVRVLSSGPRYGADDLLRALPSAKAKPVFRSAPPAKVVVATGQDGCRSTAQGATRAGGSEQHQQIVGEAAAHYSIFERELWSGNWQGYCDPLTNKEQFPSQSEADYYLARKIARWGLGTGVSVTELYSESRGSRI